MFSSMKLRTGSSMTLIFPACTQDMFLRLNLAIPLFVFPSITAILCFVRGKFNDAAVVHFFCMFNYFHLKLVTQLQYIGSGNSDAAVPFLSCTQPFNLLNAKLIPIRHLVALIGANTILHIRRIRVNL